jgi:hypothetical protein
VQEGKTLANMKDAVALYVAFYNFCRPNRAVGKRTPAWANPAITVARLSSARHPTVRPRASTPYFCYRSSRDTIHGQTAIGLTFWPLPVVHFGQGAQDAIKSILTDERM